MKNSQKQFEKWANIKLVELQNTLLLNDCRLLPIEGSDEVGFLESTFRYPYREIVIKYNPTKAQHYWKTDKDYLIKSLTHEMCHPLTDPLYTKAITRHTAGDEIEDERERLVDHIANIILKLT